MPIDENGATEDCIVWGCVSFTTEIDFRNERQDDPVDIQLYLRASRFQKLVEAISTGAVDSLALHINGVQGFYSEWSPSIRTDFVKILTQEEDHKIQIPTGAAFVPQKLGVVDECDVYTCRRATLKDLHVTILTVKIVVMNLDCNNQQPILMMLNCSRYTQMS